MGNGSSTCRFTKHHQPFPIAQTGKVFLKKKKNQKITRSSALNPSSTPVPKAVLTKLPSSSVRSDGLGTVRKDSAGLTPSRRAGASRPKIYGRRAASPHQSPHQNALPILPRTYARMRRWGCRGPCSLPGPGQRPGLPEGAAGGIPYFTCAIVAPCSRSGCSSKMRSAAPAKRSMG